MKQKLTILLGSLFCAPANAAPVLKFAWEGFPDSPTGWVDVVGNPEDLARFEYKVVKDGQVVVPKSVVLPDVRNVTVPLSGSGVYTFQIRAVDKVGNFSEWASISKLVEEGQPVPPTNLSATVESG